VVARRNSSVAINGINVVTNGINVVTNGINAATNVVTNAITVANNAATEGKVRVGRHSNNSRNNKVTGPSSVAGNNVKNDPRSRRGATDPVSSRVVGKDKDRDRGSRGKVGTASVAALATVVPVGRAVAAVRVVRRPGKVWADPFSNRQAASPRKPG